MHLATHGFFATEEATSDDETPRDAKATEDDAPLLAFEPGLLSGLVLAGANDPPKIPDDPAALEQLPEDGVLTATELAYLPLTGVELVVLSACDTGLGKAAGGEGLLGIQRAFQVAGAQSTIASLWKVDDLWTQKLMTLLYRNALEKNQPYLDALRNAQLEILGELRRGQSSQYVEDEGPRGADAPEGSAGASGSPYYWAAFTLSGDWR
jgi:CHAT domain-containing protein